MDKESKGASSKRSSRNPSSPAPNVLDPNLLAAHSLLAASGAGGAGATPSAFNPLLMTAGLPLLAAAAAAGNAQSSAGASSTAASDAATSSSAAAAVAALGGITPASATWLSLMHQLATQEYLNRLSQASAVSQAGSASAHPALGYEALAGMKAVAALANSSASGSKDAHASTSSSHSSMFRLPDGTDLVKQTSSMSGPRVPGTTKRGRKRTISLDPPTPSLLPATSPLTPSQSAAAAAAAAGGDVLTHGVSSILSRFNTEGRLSDSVTITPTSLPRRSSSSVSAASSQQNAVVGGGLFNSSLSTAERLRQLQALANKQSQMDAGTSGSPQVTITPVAGGGGGGGSTMLTSSVSLTPVERASLRSGDATHSSDAPLNLSKKASSKSCSSLSVAAAGGSPTLSLQQLAAEQQLEQFRSAMASAVMAQSAMADYRQHQQHHQRQQKEGRGRSRKQQQPHGGAGSRSKKNTVASLLATNRSSADDVQRSLEKMAGRQLTVEMRPAMSSTSSSPSSAAASAAFAEAAQHNRATSGGEGAKLQSAASNDNQNSFPYSSYLARLKREHEDSSGMDSEDVSESDADSVSAASSTGGATGTSSEPSHKRRRLTAVDLVTLRIPLSLGWRRETTIKKLTQAGPRGDVVYYAPCGKVFRQFPDIVRYLERNSIGNVSRDHFTFSSKVILGDYLKISDDGEECIPISETEVKRQVDILAGGKKKTFKKPYVINIKSDDPLSMTSSPTAMLSQAAAAPSGGTSGNFQQAMNMMRRLEEDRKMRLLKEEQKRKERELRNVQVMEERRKKQEELERQRAAESLRKAHELNKQREMLYILELERERRRHHVLLVKSLEARRRLELRDRRREDVRQEKAAQRDRRFKPPADLDVDCSRALQPAAVEDMRLMKDCRPLPSLERVSGLYLCGAAFANCLMVFEFLHNFGETLGFDMDSLPTLGGLQLGLLSDSRHEDELLSVLAHLVVCAVEDPGVFHPGRHLTLLSQTLRQADITHTALSEVVRIYLAAAATSEVKQLTGLLLNVRDPGRAKNCDYYEVLEANRTYQMSTWLQTRPFVALNPSEKTEIFAHFCNDLLQNKTVIKQIETSIEMANTRRKEKLALELRLRRLRLLHQRKKPPRPLSTGSVMPGMFNSHHPHAHNQLAAEVGVPAVVSSPSVGEDHVKKEEDAVKEVDFEDDKECEALDDSSVTHDDAAVTSMATDDLQKYIDQLAERDDRMARELFASDQTVRACRLGQDRYRRTFWVLARAGGVYVEALESAGLTPGETAPSTSHDRDCCDVGETLSVKQEVAQPVGDEFGAQQPVLKTEPMSVVNGATSAGETDGIAAAAAIKQEPGDVEPCVTPVNAGAVKQEMADLCSARPTDGVVSRARVKPPPLSSASSMNEKHLSLFLAATMTNLTSLVNSGALQDMSGSVEIEGLGQVPCRCVLQALATPEKCWFSVMPREPCQQAFVIGELSDDDEDEDGVAATNSARHDDSDCSDTGGSDKLTAPTPAQFTVGWWRVGDKRQMERITTALQIAGIRERLLHDKIVSLGNLVADSCEWVSEKARLNSDSREVGMLEFVPDKCDAVLAALNVEAVGDASARTHVAVTCSAGDTVTPVSAACNSLIVDVQSSPSHVQQTDTTIQQHDANEQQQKQDSPPRVNGCGTALIVDDSTTSAGIEAVELLAGDDATVSDRPTAETSSVCGEVSSAAANQPLKSSGTTEETTTITTTVVTGVTAPVVNGVATNGVVAEETEDGEEVEDEREKGAAGSCQPPTRPLLPVMKHSAPLTDQPGLYRLDVALNAEMFVLEQVENLEERIAQASMQVKSWRLPSRVSGDRTRFVPSCHAPAVEPQSSSSRRVDPVQTARERLCDLELNIERRYLKPPLGTSKGADLSLSQLGSEENNTVPRQLTVWRDALPRATTAAQVSMCLYMLETSIAWDKSIMKANCQFCTSGDHEEKLLLCDGCDKGYHTYCFKPSMENIPDGDWYCFECVNKATGERACVVCGRNVGKILLCEGCPRSYHADCINPPVSKIPRGKWHCPACVHKSPKKVRPKKRPSLDVSVENASTAATAPTAVSTTTTLTTTSTTATAGPAAASDTTTVASAEPTDSPPKKDRHNKKLVRELAACRSLLSDLEAHEDSWPFLLPVNTKQFPTYKKVIRSPMDLSTVKKRLLDGTHKSRDDFVADMRVMFDNCVTFNEDDSPVGKAGHNMRQFFETRWQQLCASP